MLGKDFIVSQDLDQTASGSDLSKLEWPMLKRIAQRMEAEHFNVGEPTYEALARIALESLLEPTYEMIVAATYRIDDGSKSMYASIFIAMVRAALSSPDESPEDKSRATDKLTITHELGPDGEVRLVERRVG